MLAKLSGDAQLAGVGITDPYADHRRRPLAEHVDDFGRYLSGKGDTPRHVREIVARCKAVLAGIDADAFEDLQPSAVVEFLASLRDRPDERPPLEDGQEWFTKKELVAAVGVHPGSAARLLARDGLSARGYGKARRYPRSAVEALRERLAPGVGASTTNHYLTAIKGFTRLAGAVEREPLPGRPAGLPVEDERRGGRLPGPPPRSRTGRVRRAGAGGPRRPAVPRHDRRRPSRPVPAGGAGRLPRFRAGLPVAGVVRLRRPVRDGGGRLQQATAEGRAAAALRRGRAAARLRRGPAAAPLWPGSWRDDAAEMLRLDLAAAGIDYIDAEGLVYDFHALRHQFITDLAAAGVHPKDAQVLARHSTITLTMDHYTHVRPANLQAALDKLPPVAPAPKAAKRRKACGLGPCLALVGARKPRPCHAPPEPTNHGPERATAGRRPAPCTCLALPRGTSWPLMSKSEGRASRPAFVVNPCGRVLCPLLAPRVPSRPKCPL